MISSVMVGFVLLFSPCGSDACEWVPVSEDIYATETDCENVLKAISARHPSVILECDRVYREKK